MLLLTHLLLLLLLLQGLVLHPQPLLLAWPLAVQWLPFSMQQQQQQQHLALK
jgi:hypothetical protein